MIAADVTELYAALEEIGVSIWIDGGWGVDALLGRQTRSHQDLDITIQIKDLAAFQNLLEERGYREIKIAQRRDWNFVLGDRDGREVDVHVIVPDAQGNGIYGPPENGESYPAASLTGTGDIEGRPVRCISAEWAVKFHSGYELKEKDFRDVFALCEKFGIDLPAQCERFRFGEKMR